MQLAVPKQAPSFPVLTHIPDKEGVNIDWALICLRLCELLQNRLCHPLASTATLQVGEQALSRYKTRDLKQTPWRAHVSHMESSGNSSDHVRVRIFALNLYHTQCHLWLLQFLVNRLWVYLLINITEGKGFSTTTACLVPTIQICAASVPPNT